MMRKIISFFLDRDLARLLEESEICWVLTEDPEFPLEANFDGRKLQLRVNDYPEEPLYSLMVDKVRKRNFEGTQYMPKTWVIPSDEIITEHVSNYVIKK